MNKNITSFFINDLYKATCKDLLATADTYYPDNNKLYSENIDTTLILFNPYDHVITIPERNLSLRYLFGEFAFYMKGSNKLKDINKYSKFWNSISDDGKTVSSGYGYKLFGEHTGELTQFDHAMYHLQKNEHSKRATMLINTPENSVKETKDTPCTMYLQFFIRNKELHLINHMRSQDIFFGTPYDISYFTMLQELTLVYLRNKCYPYLKMGIYIHHMGSLHLYRKDYDTIVDINDTDLEKCKEWEGEQMSSTTLDQMQIFLDMESGTTSIDTIKLTDPFLKQALYYIQGEK